MRNKHQACETPIHLDDENHTSSESTGASGVECAQTSHDADSGDVRENAHDTEMCETEQPPIPNESVLIQEQSITDELII